MTTNLLSEKEIEILASISNLRFMTTSQLHVLNGYSGKYGINVTRRKLLELERNGLLKSWQPDKYSQKIFYLTKKGAKEVEAFLGYDNIPTYRKTDKTLHHVMVSEVYVRLSRERGRINIFRLSAKVGDAVSDAFIQYQIDKRKKILFLEADRGTESMSHIKDVKLPEYQKTYNSGWWQDRYGIFPDVTFITVSDTRKRSLIKVGERFPMRVRVFTLDEFVANPLIIL